MCYGLQEECDSYQCEFDGTDCSYTTPLYDHCSAMQFDIPCDLLFNNSVCDRACNSAECLFDGWDCEEHVPKCLYDAYCEEHYADGFCDQGCNTPQCLWDGLDCFSERNFASGQIFIVVAVPPVEFVEIQTTFLRQLGSLLHAVLVVAQDSAGQEMIEPWEIYDVTSRRDRRSIADRLIDGLFRRKRAAATGYRTMLFYLFCTVLTRMPCHAQEGKRENYQVCSVQYCVQQLYTVNCTHI